MVDGAARGNPGEAGCGAVICKENGTPVEELSRYLGHATNNVAEYEGQFESYRIVHVPREENKLADRLANKGIDDALKLRSAG